MSRGRVLPLFGLCAAALLGVMAWLTLTVRRLEDAERRGREQAALEETVMVSDSGVEVLTTTPFIQECLPAAV